MSMRHDDLPKGQGKLLTDRRIALYRDESGILHAVSSVCPHRSCDVEWNAEGKVWDCPCHGSRFAQTAPFCADRRRGRLGLSTCRNSPGD